MFEYSTALNPQQRTAANHDFGPMLVRAGAGTGKTTVLTQRLLRLVETGIALPSEILAITYTNAAAEEMQDRLKQSLGRRADELTVTTFHGYCYGVLKRHRSTFGLLSKEDLWVFLRRNLEKLGLSYFAKAAEPGAFLDDLLKFFERCSDELVGPDDYRSYVESLAADPGGQLPAVGKTASKEMPSREEVIERSREIARVFATVQQMLVQADVGSFGSLIVNTARLFASDQVALQKESARARFILIDEFQDTNHAQLTIIHALAQSSQNVFVVGDPDQAIYRFRGASSGAFDDFSRLFRGAKAVTLSQNQRSTQHILDCAYSAISRNPDITAIDSEFSRIPLRSARSQRQPGLVNAPVRLVRHTGNQHEAYEIARSIKLKHAKSKCAWSDFAVLYRGNATAPCLVEEFGAQGIPVTVSGTDLLETDNMRDLLAALYCMVSLADNVSLFRLALMPRFGLDPNGLRASLQAAQRDEPVAAALTRDPAGAELIAELKRIGSRVAANDTGSRAIACVEKTVMAFGLADCPEMPFFRRFVSDWMAKPAVCGGACSGSLAEFLDYLSLWRKGGGCLRAEERDTLGARLRPTKAPDAVSLMSVHGAKGLEFRFVHIARVVSQSFPLRLHEPLFDFPQALRKSAVTVADEKRLNDEEERRLFYVALTRAKDELTLLGKQGSKNKVPAIPSLYMRQLADDAQLRDKVEVHVASPMQIPLIAASAPPQWHELPAKWFAQDLRLSASAIETYQTCPKKFYFRYEWCVPGEPTSALLYGNAIHLALAALFAAHTPGKILQLATLIQVFEANFTAAGFDDLHQHKLLVEQGRRRLTDFYARQQAVGFPSVIATEQWFSLALDGVTLTGKIDRADACGESIAIIDYKTGNAKTEQQALESKQLAVYVLAAQDLWKKPVSTMSFYNLEGNQQVSAAVSAEVLLNIQSEIASTAASIRRGLFPVATNTQVCRWCDYRGLCPATVQKFYSPALAAQSKNAAAP